ncbi:MAG: rhomboid family intramembrane serine protease [Bacteroidetes bacterium]|nr:rhomboid family intramembrane serine protease [Bacteroidota bacterium]
MFFPLADDNSDRIIKPYVNYAIIALNVLVWVFFQGMNAAGEFTMAYSTVPAEIINGHDIITQPQLYTDPNTGIQFMLPGLAHTPIHVYFTLLTSMFMHGGWLHLGGNMLYLWIFGDNIENRLGHFRYAVFYIVMGVLASLSHVFATVMSTQNSLVPSLGASGAISGVLGAYLILYPKRKVKVLFIRVVMDVPSYVALGGWILFQIVAGLGVFGGGDTGGVAYAAHIGGFIAGILLIKIFDLTRSNRLQTE